MSAPAEAVTLLLLLPLLLLLRPITQRVLFCTIDFLSAQLDIGL
jgi:hypothetical protein